MIIKNSVELTEKIGEDPSKWALKNTDTGVTLQSSIEGVTVTPYIEGEDGETHSSHFMSYPFTLHQLNTLVDLADQAAARWNEGHEYCDHWIADILGRTPWYGEEIPNTWRFQVYIERAYSRFKTTYCLWRGNSATEASKMHEVMLTRIFEETYPEIKVKDTYDFEAEYMLEQQQGIFLGIGSRP